MKVIPAIAAVVIGVGLASTCSGHHSNNQSPAYPTSDNLIALQKCNDGLQGETRFPYPNANYYHYQAEVNKFC